MNIKETSQRWHAIVKKKCAAGYYTARRGIQTMPLTKKQKKLKRIKEMEKRVDATLRQEEQSHQELEQQFQNIW